VAGNDYLESLSHRELLKTLKRFYAMRTILGSARRKENQTRESCTKCAENLKNGEKNEK